MTIKEMKTVAVNYYGDRYRVVVAYRNTHTKDWSLDVIGRVLVISKEFNTLEQITFFGDGTFCTDSLRVDYTPTPCYLRVSNWTKGDN